MLYKAKNKIQVDDHTERAGDITIESMEIVTDTSTPNKIEIYMLDEMGHRVEGGQFSKDDFMSLVRKFYNENY